MRRNPWINLPGCLLTTLLLVGVALALWWDGGRLFSPGPLTAKTRPGVVLQGFASHADFENQCSWCHRPLQTTQTALCVACHRDVAEQMANQTGVHGRLTETRCAACHADHRGRDFDPTLQAVRQFDHEGLGFSLAWHQALPDGTPIGCADCHAPDYTAPVERCAGCHGRLDAAFMAQHRVDFGPQCLACHDGVDHMVGFDHGQTAFPLIGAHAGVPCAACHGAPARGGQPTLAGTPATCAACHAEPQAHQGLFGTDCAACHQTTAWAPARWQGAFFDHELTAFSLVAHRQDRQGRPIACTACHVAAQGLQQGVFDTQACVLCHRQMDAPFMQQHLQRYGRDCQACHDGTGKMRNFDHNRVFPLDGAHARLACEACHAQHRFARTPRTCAECHAEPDIHRGFFGLRCNWCHTTQAWAPAFLHVHPFPLDHGGRGEVACAVCHPQAYVAYTCYGCHAHQEAAVVAEHLAWGIARQDLPACAHCHPTGRRVEPTVTPGP